MTPSPAPRARTRWTRRLIRRREQAACPQLLGFPSDYRVDGARHASCDPITPVEAVSPPTERASQNSYNSRRPWQQTRNGNRRSTPLLIRLREETESAVRGFVNDVVDAGRRRPAAGAGRGAAGGRCGSRRPRWTRRSKDVRAELEGIAAARLREAQAEHAERMAALEAEADRGAGAGRDAERGGCGRRGAASRPSAERVAAVAEAREQAEAERAGSRGRDADDCRGTRAGEGTGRGPRASAGADQVRRSLRRRGRRRTHDAGRGALAEAAREGGRRAGVPPWSVSGRRRRRNRWRRCRSARKDRGGRAGGGPVARSQGGGGRPGGGGGASPGGRGADRARGQRRRCAARHRPRRGAVGRGGDGRGRAPRPSTAPATRSPEPDPGAGEAAEDAARVSQVLDAIRQLDEQTTVTSLLESLTDRGGRDLRQPRRAVRPCRRARCAGWRFDGVRSSDSGEGGGTQALNGAGSGFLGSRDRRGASALVLTPPPGEDELDWPPAFADLPSGPQRDRGARCDRRPADGRAVRRRRPARRVPRRPRPGPTPSSCWRGMPGRCIEALTANHAAGLLPTASPAPSDP